MSTVPVVSPTPIERYRAMVVMRRFEEACIRGMQQKEIHGELHTGIGQEGVAAGMLGSLLVGDALVSTHRNHLHAIAKGVSMQALMAEIFERETGLCRGRGGHMHPFDREKRFSATGIVGSSLPVALGYAYAFQLENVENVAVGVTGEGGSNAGAFHECMNIAATWKLPFVILVENNGWAISVPFNEVTATSTVSQRASGYDAWGQTVDGLDPDVVATAFAEAMLHARSRRGPAILEVTCARFRGHYEGDHDGYRPAETRKRMRESRDPLKYYREKLMVLGLATDSQLATAENSARDEIATIVAAVKAAPNPDPSEAMRYSFVGV